MILRDGYIIQQIGDSHYSLWEYKQPVDDDSALMGV
jgi:hypothetical protein